MRRERITYIGAYHHVMVRGYDGNDIFAQKPFPGLPGGVNQTHENSNFCLLYNDASHNHYHLVLENSSGICQPIIWNQRVSLSNLDSLAHNEIPVRMTKHGEIK